MCTLVPAALVPRALEALWTGLETMAAGQRRDVALFHAERPDLREVESALAKTSGEIGLAAALGALTAHCDDAPVREWQRFGADVGYGLQLASDCQDVADPASRDIASGARTLPIAFALQELDVPARQVFLDHLRRARSDRAAHSEARNALLGTRALHASLTLVEARVARAERRLSELAPADPGSLATFIAGISWLRRG
jgi:geranylgeranyl pyrophosphate synthase